MNHRKSGMGAKTSGNEKKEVKLIRRNGSKEDDVLGTSTCAFIHRNFLVCSLGVILYTMVTGNLPYPDRDFPEDSAADVNGTPTEEQIEFGEGGERCNVPYLTNQRFATDLNLQKLKRRQHFQIPPWCSPDCEDLIRKLLQVREPKERRI